MNRWVVVGMLWAGAGIGSLKAQTCQIPPLSGGSEIPNIMIVIDTSGSMAWRAYWTVDPDGGGPLAQGEYDPNFAYYGYFNPDRIYRYNGNVWIPVANESPGSSTWRRVINPGRRTISGNILNWATMARIDILKKVLTGGEGRPTGALVKDELRSYLAGGWGFYYGYGAMPIRAADGNVYVFERYGDQRFYLYRQRGGGWDYMGNFNTYVDVRSENVDFRLGVIRKIGDKDLDGQWDSNAPRFALMSFSSNPGALKWEFYQNDSTRNILPFYQRVNELQPGGGTGVADALLSAYHYISYQQDEHWGTFSFRGRGTQWDPMYADEGGNLVPVPCRRNFVLIMGDGESNSDAYHAIPDGHFPGLTRDADNDGNIGDRRHLSPWSSECPRDGCDNLADDYAYYMYRNDIRSDITGTQNIITYAIFSFGLGGGLFNDIATNGGGEFYNPQSGIELENAIKSAILNIVARANSGTATGLVSTGARGEGTIGMAFYFPRMPVARGALSWVGGFLGLWLDPWGNLRGDLDQDHRLDLTQDPIVVMKSPLPGALFPRVILMSDPDGDGIPDAVIQDTNLAKHHLPIWDAAESLRVRDPASRNIFVVRSSTGSVLSFQATNPTLVSYLSSLWGIPAGSTMAIIDYIRGVDRPDFRNRRIDALNDPPGQSWKLGDIVHSTPTYVGKPAENYHILYGDQSYARYVSTYQNRPGTYYVGANDGMLHAFHAGRYVPLNTTSRSLVGRLEDDGVPLGKERWALIPSSVLVPLVDYPQKNYCHYYFIDNKGKATDVKIFTPDATHPDGWGTILIQGMGLGCLGSDFSSILFLDVTKPDSVHVLKEYRDPTLDLGFTTSYPAVARIQSGSNTKWFAVVGSGPDYPDGWASPTKGAFLYVFDLSSSGIPVTKFNLSSILGIGASGAFVGDPTTVDVDLDYSVDVIYFPLIYRVGTSEVTALVRVNTHGDLNPSNWTFSVVTQIPRPQVAGVNVSLRLYGGKIWVFGGTGRFFNRGDAADTTSTEYFYGILDPWTTVSTSPIINFSGLKNMTQYAMAIDTSTGAYAVLNPVGDTVAVDTILQQIRLSNGWRVSLGPNKVLNLPLILAGSIFFTTFRPGATVCATQGTGYLWVLNYELGTASREGFLGVDTQQHSVRSVSLGTGTPSAPTLHVGTNSQAVIVQTGEGVIRTVQRQRGGRALPSRMYHFRPYPIR